MIFQGKDKTRNVLFLCLILLAATVYYFFFSQAGSTMRFSQEDNTLVFYGPKSTSAEFDLDDVISVTLETEPDYGEASRGGTIFGGNQYGIWESGSLGVYEAFVTTRIRPCIVIMDSEKTAVFNYSNEETTSSLYEQLRDYLEIKDLNNLD